MASTRTMLTNILADSRLDKNEFLQLRKKIFQDGHIGIAEADMIFAVDTQISDLPEGWNDFFVSAITDFLIRQTLPIGYVDPIHATWLMERIDADDRMSEQTEEELLLNVLRLAEDSPEALEIYALNKIRAKIVNCSKAGRFSVTEDHVNLIKRILYASGGHSGLGVSRKEAAFLFELDEATAEQDNHGSWQKLFVGAIANHVMTQGAPMPIARADYQRAHEYLHSTQGFKWDKYVKEVKKIQWWNPIALYRICFKDDDVKESMFVDEGAMLRAESVDMIEAKWLIDHLNRDGKISPNEQALLRFIREECPDIHESLNTLIKAA